MCNIQGCVEDKIKMNENYMVTQMLRKSTEFFDLQTVASTGRTASQKTTRMPNRILKLMLLVAVVTTFLAYYHFDTISKITDGLKVSPLCFFKLLNIQNILQTCKLCLQS